MEYIDNELVDTERNGEIMLEFIVQVVAENGLGFGKGSIGVESRLSPEAKHPIDENLLQAVDAAIESPQILVPVDKDDDGELVKDDGCGDGRDVLEVMVGAEIKKRSLNRSKVFGGGATMSTAARIGTGQATGELKEEFKLGMDACAEHAIDYGAHTDDHAEGKNCGCGAIDKAPEIVAAALVFREGIENAIQLLTGVKTEDNVVLAKVFKNYESYAQTIIDNEYSGADVMSEIIGSGKVIKRLTGPHKEVRTVVNIVKGYTPNQALIREVSGEEAQIFAVDEWRIRELADGLYDEPTAKDEAYYSMLVYTLATAGVLTEGDLKVYAVIAKEQFVTAA